MGAIGVVEMERMNDVGALRNRFIDLGVFIRPFGNVIYLTPSFTITGEEKVPARRHPEHGEHSAEIMAQVRAELASGQQTAAARNQ